MNTSFSTFPKTISLPANSFPAGLFGGAGISLTIASGLTTLIGPNGSGKTKAMASLRDSLRDTYGASVVRFVSAGRMGILENFRSNFSGTNRPDPNDTSIGNYSWVNSRKANESVMGDFFALLERADLKLKVESRLQGLFNRTVKLSWVQNGLKIDFQSLDIGAAPYGAGGEASGLTHLVAILAALYDDEIKFLLIDEPEVSLHPQLQAFVLKEMQQVIGNPDVDGKKCIVISTHSPSMLALKSITDLPSLVFFGETNETPVQINAGSPVMTDPFLGSVILRISESYKIAMFANNILLSEGLSDEIVVNAIADLKNGNFLSTGVQIVPVSGKGDLKAADLMFNAIGKKTYMLGDLDVLDERSLCEYLDREKSVTTAVNGAGFSTLADQFNDLKSDLASLIASNWADISSQAATQRFGVATQTARERSVLSFLASAPAPVLSSISNSGLWIGLKTKLIALLDIMDDHGLVLIRKGSIEDCYLNTAIPTNASKPEAALLEATYLKQNNPPQIDSSYEDILKAINKIKRLPQVDEAALLRQKLGAVLGAIEANFTDTLDDIGIERIISSVDPEIVRLFEIKKRTASGPTGLEIKVVSKLFSSYGTTIIHNKGESINNLLTKLPSS